MRRPNITLFQNRQMLAASPRGDLQGPQKGEAGADGEDWLTDLQGGGPDVNPELTGSAKFDVYSEMVKTDPTIKSLVFLPSLSVRSAAWGLNPSDDDPLCKLIRDMVAWNLGLEDQDGQLDLSWDELLQQALKSLLTYGPCIEELVWGDVTTWRDKDGDEHVVRPLARVAFRPPRTITKVVREKGRIVLVEQGNTPSAQPMMGDRVSYMVFEREDNHWDGVSPLRPAWGAWRVKKNLIVKTGIGWDRFAFGLPTIWHPDTPEGEEMARSIGRSIQAHERGYVHFPVPADGSSKADSQWDLEVKHVAGTLPDPVPILKWCSEQESEAFAQQFTKLGMTDTGSRAVGEVQIDPFFLAVQSLAKYVRLERSRQVIRRLVEVNFGAEAADRSVPNLTVSKIQRRNLQILAEVIAQLEPLGFRLTERDDQDDVREELGFGKLPDDLASRGIDPDRLKQILASAGLDEQQLANIVNGLPADLGVARNRVPVEGNGIAT
jgi:hypothetical protein